MTKRQKRRLLITIFTISLIIFTAERAYNSREIFQVKAKDASHYGVVEAMLTTREKLKDFDHLYRVLEENYPFFETNQEENKLDWFKNKRKYKRLIRNTKSDADFYLAMKRILGDLNDFHVDILNGKEFKELYKTYYLESAQDGSLEDLAWFEVFSSPFVMFRYQFDGKIDHIDLYKEGNLETKILKEDEVAYMKIGEMVDLDLVDRDLEGIEDFLKQVRDYEKLIIDIRGNKGGQSLYWERLVGLLTKESLNKDYYSFFKRGHRQKLDPYRVENIDSIRNLEDNILKKLPREIVENFDFYKLQNISIKPLNPSKDTSFQGKIYLLVDGGVFAEAEAFANFAKATGFATLVGEPTGGGMTFEKVPIVFLPTSKFAIKYSREIVFNKDSLKLETKTQPDILVDSTPHHDIKKDLCIQAVIKDGKK